MTSDIDRRRRLGYVLFGVGVALNVLALFGSRYLGQRVLYVAAGVLFLVAAIARLRESRGGGPDQRGGSAGPPPPRPG